MTLRIAHIVAPSFLQIDSGGTVKTAAIATALASLGELHVFQEEYKPWDKQHQNGTTVKLPFGGEARLYSALSLSAGNAVSGVAAKLAKLRFFRHRHIAKQIRAIKPDLIIADDTQTASVLKFLKDIPRATHTHNVESQILFDLADRSADDKKRAKLTRKAKRCQRIERKVFPKLDRVFAVSENDLGVYQRWGLTNVALLPNIVPVPEIDEQVIATENTAIFVGSLWWQPNADAADYLIGFAARLLAADSSQQIEIIGKGASEHQQLSAPDNLKFCGFVENLAAKMASCSAVLIPLEWGGGTKIKTLEALAAGKPVVTTPEGARGLSLEDGEHAIIRPLGNEFDNAAIEVMKNPEKYDDMGLRGRAYVEKHYSLQHCTDTLRAYLTEQVKLQ